MPHYFFSFPFSILFIAQLFVFNVLVTGVLKNSIVLEPDSILVIVSYQQTHAPYLISVFLLFLCVIVFMYLYRMSPGECAKCLENIPYIKLH